MKKLYLLLALLFLPLSRSASADTFNFDFSSADFSGSGVLFTNPTSTQGQFLIYDATGSVDIGASRGGVQAITSVLPPFPSPNNFQDNDNLLFYPPSPGFFDLNGFSFTLSNGAQVNLFYDPASGGGTFYMDINGTTVEENATFHVTAVTPEPSSWILLGTGSLGVVGTLRRRICR